MAASEENIYMIKDEASDVFNTFNRPQTSASTQEFVFWFVASDNN